MSRIAFVPLKSVHTHGVQDLTSEFTFMMNHIVNFVLPSKPMFVFLFLGVQKKEGLHRGESNAICNIKIGW